MQFRTISTTTPIDTVYLSDSPTLNTPGARYWTLGSVVRAGGLGGGDTYGGRLDTVLTPAAQGQYIIVETNTGTRAWEGVYTTNNQKSIAANIVAAPSDLVVESVRVVSPQNYSGERTEIEWTVKNQGGDLWSGTRYWYDEVWLSTEAQFNPALSTKVGFFLHHAPNGLTNGATSTQRQSIVLPSGIEGNYYVHVSTNYSYDWRTQRFRGEIPVAGYNDVSRQSFEYRVFENPSNNLNQTAFPVVYREPDLKVSQPTLSDGPFYSGQPLNLSWNVQNIGNRSTRESSWVDRVYLSKDAALDRHDTLLKEVRRRGALGQGESYTVRNTEILLPDGIEGDYYLLVFADSNLTKLYPDDSTLNFDSNGPLDTRVPEFRGEGNNIEKVALPIRLTQPPDLQVVNVGIPQRGTPGQGFNLSYTVKNFGTGATPPRQSQWQDRIYLSRDRFLDVNRDYYLETVSHTGRLALNGEYTIQNRWIDLPIDPSLTGSFYVFVLTDPGDARNPNGKVFECGKDNNNATASLQPLLIELPPPADLQVDTIGLSQTSAKVGDRFTLNWTVTNRGINPAQGTWSDAVYLSEDETWDIGDRFLGRVGYTGKLMPVGTANAGETSSYTGSLAVDFPAVTPGQYRIIVRPDILNQIYEADRESNNFKTSENNLSATVDALQLGVPLQTSLSAGQDRLYAITVAPGQTLKIDAASQNPSATSEIFVGFNAAPSSTDFVAASKGFLTAQPSVLVPTTQAGTYYVLVRGVEQSGNATIRADVLPFSITDVESDRGGDSRYVTVNITGAQFHPQAIVKLVRPGIHEEIPVNAQWIDSTRLTTVFDLSDAPRGLYDVKVINPDGKEAIVPYRYLVERAIQTDVTVGLGGPSVLAPGDLGTYGVSVKSMTNLDTPYVHFQFGIPELGINDVLEGFPYAVFTSNLRGTPQANLDVPWASLVSDINRNGQILAPGYVFDLPNAGFVGQTFNVQTYPGLADKLKQNPKFLEGYDDGSIAFRFHILATATALTRDEFIAQQTQEALKLREAALKDTTATQALTLLASDRSTWVNSYLAALEDAGLLRPEQEAPPIRQTPQVLSTVATLATGLLLGPAGNQIVSEGNLIKFFEQIRRWYGNTPEVRGSAIIPDLSAFNLNTSRPTHTQAFNIYVPYGEARLDLPPSVTVPNPNFSSFLNGSATSSDLVSLSGPLGYGQDNFVPQGIDLPYTIRFENAATATRSTNEVRIVTQLDDDLDARTFQLGTLRLGDIQVTIPGGRGSFQGDFDFTQSKGFILRVSAGVEPISNVATWLIQAIDPLTGEVLQNRSAGLLPPNDAQGQGAGWINYTIQPKSDRTSGTEISSEARVFFNTAAPMETGRVTNLLDATAPTTTLTVTPLANGIDYNVQWSAIDDGEGSGLKHVNVYVSENGGDFTLWQRQTTATNGVFAGKAGHTYEFLALATDQAGNQEQPRPGIAAPQDGTTTNLGTLPTNSSASAITLNSAPQPSQLPSTNPLFQAVESGNGIPAANSLSRPAEFDQVLRPFSIQAFATGIDRSHGNIAPLAIAQLPDGSVLMSGGANRGSIYRVSAQGGRVDAPLVTLEQPLFDFALDRNGTLWATTGGGALLQLNAQTGQIIRQYGDGLTQSLAIDPSNGKIYVSSGRGIEVFNPITETFEHFSDLRVGSLAFNPTDGKLWGAVWPDRGDVVRFDATGKAQRMLQLDAPVDSIAFGQPGTQLAGLLFVSTNDNPNTTTQQDGDLLLVDLVTLRRVAIATGGSRGDIVRTTTDGRLLISQSNQVDVLSPLLAPKVAFTNPAPDATIALPDGDLTITFDQDMFLGFGIEAHSVINRANYELVGKTTGIRPIRDVIYDPATKTARLEFDALAADEYEIRVASTIRAVNGMDLTGGYVEQFTAISDFSAYLDIQFSNARSDRFNRTVSFDVTLTNKSEQDLRLPLMLMLDPGAQVTGQPIGAIRDPQGSYLIDLSQNLPDGKLGRGATTTTRTITVSNPDALRTDFTAGVYTVPYANAAPVIQSTPGLTAIAGQPYSYNVAAIDPDGGSLSYFLYRAPEGMTIDGSGQLRWTPTSQSSANTEVVLKVYDNRGGSIDQSFRIGVTGGNQLPVFSTIPTQLRAKEGQPFQFTVNATDGDRHRLVYWMENLPGGAKFESATRTLTWTPGFEAAGTYENVTFVVSDGISQVAQQTTLLVAPTNQAPTLTKPSDRTVLEGETIRIQLRGTDAESSALTYSSNLLPGGATLSPTGLFEWTPAYFQAGTFTIPFSASDGETVTTQTTTITVGNVNAAPLFDQLGNWTIQEGQEVRFRAFAFDPDNPGFIPQERNLQGQLTLLEGSNPSVSYSVSGLPTGASFDAMTAMFSWRPEFDRAGTYAVTFTAIDDGNGLGAKQATVTVPITVLNTNRQPKFEGLSNQTVNHGEVREMTIRATDEDRNPLVLTARGQGGFGLPSFASFVDRGDGTATLRVTPGMNDGGNYPLFFTVTDNAGGIAETSFVLSVNAPFSGSQGSTSTPTGNQPPRITPLPLQVGQENVELQFTIAANDAESGTPILTPLSPLPTGAIFNSRTGAFRWKPTYEQAGQYAFRFEAKDAAGLTSVETVNVYIGNVNRSPALAVSNRSIALGETLRFSVAGTDPDANSTLTYTVDRLPEGATFNGQTGEFAWTPTAGQIGDYTINFSTSDGSLSATKPVVLRVVTAPQVPTVTIDLTPSFAAIPGQRIALQAIADSFAAITNLTLSVNGQPLTLDGQGRGYFTATTTGRFEVTATAIDADGRVGRQSTVLKVRDVADSAAPIVTFAPGLEGSRVSGLSQIVGTVSDVNLDSWTLELADLGEGATRSIAAGHGTISGGVLEQLDGSQLTDGFYQVRLSATDISGRKSTTAAIVEVQSGTKSGQYLKQETDLSVDLGGVRVNLVRSYDSLQRDEIGLFGAGWSLAAIESQIQTNVPPTGNEATGVYNPFQTGTRLYLTTPTGDRVGFTFTPAKQEIAGLTYYEPAWVADAGVNYTLQSADAKLTQQGDRFYDLHSGRPYNPASGKFTGAEYTLTAADGTRYELSSIDGVKRQIAPNGTTLFYSDSGITSSTGKAITFVKDASGRLMEMIAPDGTRLSYRYESGNLVTVRGVQGSTSRYGYDAIDPSLLTLVTASPGEAGQAIDYSTGTPQVLPVSRDLGGVTQFNGQVMTLTGSDRLSFSVRESELQTTANGVLLLSVEVSAPTGTSVTTLPSIQGLTPVSTQINGNRGLALYAIDRAGLQLLEMNGVGSTNYTVKLAIAGDVNTDGIVDGADSGLLKNAITGGYDAKWDVNGDRTLNAVDMQMLGGNYGFISNRAPVVKPLTFLTHVDLETAIPLGNLAIDPEGDTLSYRISNPAYGTVSLAADGQTLRFIPAIGFSGTASFDLIADDGFSTSTTGKMTINVSNAPLLNLDFVQRGPRLEVGGSTELVVLGDFADQQDVILPDSYLTYGLMNNNGVAAIDSAGFITGLQNGTEILRASRGNIQAVTTLRVGQIPAPTNQAQLDVAIAEQYGLNVYPQAVTLTEGATRNLLVRSNVDTSSPNLAAETGIRYFVSNPDLLTVNSTGVITIKEDALPQNQSKAVTNVTVIYGASEFVVPVQVATPQTGATVLGNAGGIVQANDGSGAMIMIAPGGLTEPTLVNLTSLKSTDLPTLSLPFLTDNFDFAGGFRLEFGQPQQPGEDYLNLPAQLAIPIPEGLPNRAQLLPGKEVFLLREGLVPDVNGVWQPTWIIEESAIVGADGVIRTQSPPWAGVQAEGNYTIAVPKFEYYVGKVDVETTLNLAGLGLVTSFAHLGQGLVAKAPISTALGAFGLAHSFAVPILLSQKLQSTVNSVDVVTIPKVGRLPYVSSAKVELNPQGIPTAFTTLRVPAPESGMPDSSAPPLLRAAKLESTLIAGQQVEQLVYLMGDNFLIQSDSVGSQFTDLVVQFQVQDQVYQGTILPHLSQNLGNNQFKVAVQVPEQVVLGESAIHLVRKQSERRGPGSADVEIVQYRSQQPIRLSPNQGKVDLALVAQTFADQVSIINAYNPEAILAESGRTSLDLLTARIPVGTEGISDSPRDVAATHNATRAYVTLEQSGKLALIDLMTMRQVDTDAQEAGMTMIELTPDAAPRRIVISPDDRFAYVTDQRQGRVYIVDIHPNSATYNQMVDTIDLGRNRINQLALNSDGTRLFVTQGRAEDGNGRVYVINTDAKDRPREGRPNTRKWHEVIGKIQTEAGTEGVAKTPESNKMIFTTRTFDAKGFGVLSVTNNTTDKFAATTDYTNLSLGSANDYFDVNEGVSVSMVRVPSAAGDGSYTDYAFVAGFNGRLFGSGIPSIDAPQAGSNVGIIKNPLTPQAKLVGATRPIPLGLTSDLTLSGNGKYLYAAYPGVRSVFGFNVQELINAIEAPEHNVPDGSGKVPLTYKPIDDLNPQISLAADLQYLGTEGGSFDWFGVWEDFETGFGVPAGSTRPPLGLGGNPFSMTTASTRKVVELTTPVRDELVSPGATTTDLTPTFEWRFNEPLSTVKEVNLFVSTFARGEGLLPWDSFVNLSDSQLLPNLTVAEKRELLSDRWQGYDDFNPGRILTATWKRDTNTWYWHDGTTAIAQPVVDPANTITRFTLPNSRGLTAGQTYHVAVQAVTDSGSDTDVAQFSTAVAPSNTPFSSVTVLTHGFTIDPSANGVDAAFLQMANQIAEAGNDGLILHYHKRTGHWLPIDAQGRFNNSLTGGLAPEDTGYLDALANGIRTQYVGRNKSLILLPEWSLGRESIIPDAGFSEAAADALFAAIVQLDQRLYTPANGGSDPAVGLVNGQFVRNQGALLNSPLHFVGFSRGTVVNSEIVQRLGVYYPNAGGTSASNRDLQMTTLDPHDFNQPSLRFEIPTGAPGQVLAGADFRDFYEPSVQVWNNVTFSDNYYQTVADPNDAFTFTPNGRSIPSDLELLLGTRAGQPGRERSRYGFTQDDRLGGTHLRVQAWYAGTVDLKLEEARTMFSDRAPQPTPILDRLGDPERTQWYDTSLQSALPWYREEGNREGWFYSVLGGGKAQRQADPAYRPVDRTPVSNDNTRAGMQGDFAVPTLFNGNFEHYISNREEFYETGRSWINKGIPGWSLHNGNAIPGLLPIGKPPLVEWRSIANDSPNFATHMTKLGIDPNAPNYESNYALQLKSGESITHNRFVVPDWGALRFDLFVPELTGGTVIVTLEGETGNPEQTLIELVVADGRNTPGSTSEISYPDGYVDTDTYRIGYGTQGFETFHINVPDALRGKLATVKFEVRNGSIFLDDVFFKSEHLLLGNPSEARSNLVGIDPNNYLIERPQYSLSFNNTTKAPNWVSWQLNQSWMGDVKRPGGKDGYAPPNYNPVIYPWKQDNLLPPGLNSASPFDYLGTGYVRGHTTPVADRDRHLKDIFATFFTTNAIAQAPRNNDGPWQRLEEYAQDVLVTSEGKELYIVAGGYDYQPLMEGSKDTGIDRPNHVWKVIAVLEPGQSIADITSSTRVIAVDIPNEDSVKGTKWDDPRYLVSIKTLENRLRATGANYQFFSNIPESIREELINKVDHGASNRTLTASLLSSSKASSDITKEFSIMHNLSGWENSISVEAIAQFDSFKIGAPEISTPQNHITQTGVSKISTDQTGSFQRGSTKSSSTEISFNEISPHQKGSVQGSITQVSTAQIDIIHDGFQQVSTAQINPAQIGITQTSFKQVSSSQISVLENYALKMSLSQISPSQHNIAQVSTSQFGSNKVPFTSSITSQEFLNAVDFSMFHNSYSLLNAIKDSALVLWNPPSFVSPIALNFIIKDLPLGQLAEARITQFDIKGHPIAGNVLIDIDGNGLGWFIDSTPWDNSEFSSQPATTTYRATPGSPAFGRYDLLTTILHELGHLQGLIAGNPAYDAQVRSPNNIPTFIGNGFSIPLTVDRSHTAIPTDLMSPYLSPGMRKLPSWENLQMLDAIRAWSGGEMGGWGDGEQTLSAFQKTTPLIGITNGEFDRLDQWDSRGAVQLLNAQATLSERSPLFSNLSQTFLIPEGAKALQFTLVDADLDPSRLAPGDAFEVALLNAATLTPLINPASGLNHTDAFFNLQHSGQTFLGRGVNVTQNVDRTRTITIDLTGIPAHTLATLSFDLLGFGTQEGSVTLDRVRILNDLAPVANNDSATLTQGQSTAIAILNNDSPNTALNPLSVQITTPTPNGTLTPNPDGTVTYIPNAGFVGTDSFTYTVQSVSGERSNQATVTLTVNNAAPVITSITQPNTIQEGTSTQLSAIATDPGNDRLTYTWNFGDGTAPVVGGATVNHTYADDGAYTATVTVTDPHGASTTQSIALTVQNVAPTITQWTLPNTLLEGMKTTFSAIATDPGRDTLTYTWDFGDGTAPVLGTTPTHTFAQPGSYTVTLTVQDEDGGITRQTQRVTVDRFAAGSFVVGAAGRIDFDYLHDGGGTQPEIGIFSLDGMDHLAPTSTAFIKEAARRALSHSALGHVVLRDRDEGAKFVGGMGEPNLNRGTYLGEKSVALPAGTRFAFIIVPGATLRDVFNTPKQTGNRRPLFSLDAANPLTLAHLGDVTGQGRIFGWETLRLDEPSDQDYNDIVFRLSGATGRVRSLDGLLASQKDWRITALGQQILKS